MDHRIAFKSNTELCLCNSRGEEIHLVIENEIGRGGSCIVYEASRLTGTGDKTLYRLKEFYPYKLNITRDKNGNLSSLKSDNDDFSKQKEQFRSEFSRTNKLFYSDNNYSSFTNQLEIFDQNGTCYILSAYSSLKTLATYKPQSLKECISIVKLVAYVLDNIHKQGYLYLDTKPDNVLIVDGYQKQVQLFDFDSLFPIQGNPLSSNNIKLSYSKGFAPIELQTSKIKRLGVHTDVYSIGALLFYLLFGTTPTAPDCQNDAVFDFSKIQYDYLKCDDKLFTALSDFFHNALAVYYADRYQSMQIVVEKLEEIEKYSDTVIPRIYSTKIVKPIICYGREKEFEELDKLLDNHDYNCIIVSGMGGIGKSTFIKQYLSSRRNKFDTVLYTIFKNNIEATISDDRNIEISTLKQDEEIKSDVRYFDKKIQKIRELVRNTNSVLVIDNFNGDFNDDLKALLEIDLKVILLSRNNPNYQNCLKMSLSAISDHNALQRIFEVNLGRSISENEQDSFNQIINHIGGHTLVLELIAKQIANSHITVLSAAELTKEYGFSAIALEKVYYEKDSTSKSDTIGNIVDSLFETNILSDEKKILMKVLSLLGDSEIDINLFRKIMELSSNDDLNELIQNGWLAITGDNISMHNVINEAVHRWEWTSNYLRAAEKFLTYFYAEINFESKKNNCPTKLRAKSISEQKHIVNNMHLNKIYSNVVRSITRKYEPTGDLPPEVQAILVYDSPADIERLTELLSLAENIIYQCQREDAICNTEIYLTLFITVLLNMPKYRDDFVFSELSQNITESADIINSSIFQNSSEDLKQNAIAIMRIHRLIYSIYDYREDTKSMKIWIDKAFEAAKRLKNNQANAIFYDMLAGYYDVMLGGAYDTSNSHEEYLLKLLLFAIDRTIHYSKKNIFLDSDHLYAKSLLSKATILTRSKYNKSCERKISKLLNTAKKVIEENTSEYADVRIQYSLACAWYYALLHEDIQQAELYINDAYKLADIIMPTDLQKIDEVISPSANIFYESECYDKAMSLLSEGTRLCAKHPNSDSYAIIRQDLYDHLLEVGIAAEKYDECQKLIDFIDIENKGILELKNNVIVPDEIISYIHDKT